MGQYEILAWLVKEANKDRKAWFTSDEIRSGLKKDGKNYFLPQVRRCLFPLLNHGYLEKNIERGKGFSITPRYKATDRAIKEVKP